MASLSGNNYIKRSKVNMQDLDVDSEQAMACLGRVS